MPKKRLLRPLALWDIDAVTGAFQEAGVKLSHVTKLYSALARNPELAYEEIVGLPKAACQLLEQHFVRSTSEVVDTQTSCSGDTTKLLVKLQDGMQVEAVIMHYQTTSKEEIEGEAPRQYHRATLCVSSQVGCQMGCTFCATGTMGLKGDLSSGEILEQLVHARKVSPIKNVVFMGMGEPLNNYLAVKAAVSMMTDSKVFGLRRSSVTVSTVGVVPRILQLAEDLPGVSLALSLHAPTQELRQQIVPSARAYKLDKLIAAVDLYQSQTDQKVFIEYVMLANVNDGREQAHQLGELLQGKSMVINLIPWNPVYSPGIAFAAPKQQALTDFQSILKKQYNLHCTVRQEKGQDISGACGQLVIEHSGTNNKCQSSTVKDIEELAVGKQCIATV